MADGVRRVVTGHSIDGTAMVLSDELIASVSRQVGAGITGSEIWSTAEMPVSNSADALSSQLEGFVKRFNAYNYVGNGEGTAFRITTFAPGHARFTHRTESLDYAIVLSGSIDMELDDGNVVSLNVGDVVVQRGTTHTWLNKRAVPAVMAFILIDAKAVVINGQSFSTFYPDASDLRAR
ncbi:cupin domain-containing protein [Paraburkholderia caribensis]|uniref:cupin domain-containing protein n=1 Tax=Paraburkholderia caribensis TaxID=75105 RepID=UPI001CB0323A|nr:cupin domain-containing protein [Paraburkholderia caribensis]CAG9243878.1 Cupin_2 domain-containing protein [Paraburkholderia caribensis]